MSDTDDTKRLVVEIEYARKNYTRASIRSINEQVKRWNEEFSDDELVAERLPDNTWTVYPKVCK